MKKKVVFIVSYAHSGSTLVDKVIGNHPDMFSLGEIDRYYEVVNKEGNICGCGQEYTKCNFWDGVYTELNTRKGGDVRKDPNIFKTTTKVTIGNSMLRMLMKTIHIFNVFIFGFLPSKYKTSIMNMGEYYSLLMEKSGKDILVDSSKNLFRAMLCYKLLRKKFDIKILFLVRDGRAVMYSFQKKEVKFNVGDGSGEVRVFKKKKIKDPYDIVNGWVRQTVFCLTLLKIFAKKKDIINVQYEKLVTEQEASVKEIMQWIGVDYSPGILDLSQNENHMMGGHPARINAKKINPPSEVWREKLPKEMQDIFQSKAGRLNKHLGYND
jgi:hypothetical protein